MDVFLRKYFWIISLAVAAVNGLLIGRAAVRYFEATVLSSKDLRSMPHRPTAAASPQKAYAKDADEIIKRNLFCSSCAPKKEETPDGGTAAPTSNEPQKSSLQLELVSTMVCPTDPDWSMAVIRDSSTKEKDPVMYNKGKKISTTNAVVALVVNRKVYFHNNNRLEYIDMDDKTPPPPPEKKAEGPAPAGPAPEAGEYDKSINCQGSNCTIDRALVDKLLSNTNALASAARFVPSVKEGKPNGFKVYAIRPNSLFAKIGLQNGDTIKGINGFEMTSPDKALEVYTKLRSASHLGVQLDRRGETVTLDYTIK